MSNKSEDIKIFKGQSHIYTGMFILIIWGALIFLLYHYPHLKDCNDNGIALCILPVGGIFFVLIPAIFMSCVSGKIVFQKNGIKLSGNGEYSGFYKYSEFQKVSYSFYGVSLSTTSDREVLQINLADFSIDDRNSILEEFRKRNKEIIVDDIWYGIIPERIVKEENYNPFVKQILCDKGFIAYALIVFYITSFAGIGLSDAICYVEPYDGIKKEYYENGNLKIEAEFKNGKQNGIVKEYDKNGTLRVETKFKDGKQDGIRKEYSEQGHLIVESTFSNDKQHGITKAFYEQGKLKAEAEFNNGVVDGFSRQYYENGNLQYDGNIIDDKPEGITKFYYENGQLKFLADFKYGVGIGTLYDEKGNIIGQKKMICNVNGCNVVED